RRGGCIPAGSDGTCRRNACSNPGACAFSDRYAVSGAFSGFYHGAGVDLSAFFRGNTVSGCYACPDADARPDTCSRKDADPDTYACRNPAADTRAAPYPCAHAA
ncbi:MAG: hypothetical protein J6M64_12350, partial [Oscillospiraceae bacterium]|nr:hypothetical protein [Oscillospiraceae bacterium]